MPTDLDSCSPAEIAPLKSCTLYDSVIIEVLPSKEHTPSDVFQKEFKKRLEKYRFCKAQNVHFVIRDIPKEKIPVRWTYEMIRKHEKKYRILYDRDSKDRNLILFVANLPGQSIQPGRTSIAGLQYTDTSFCYFYQGRETLATWLHEFGHIAGLVNRKWRKDKPVNPNRPDHCNNKKCYMYWIIGGTYFCDKCRKDVLWMMFLDQLERSSKSDKSSTKSGPATKSRSFSSKSSSQDSSSSSSSNSSAARSSAN